MLFLLTKNITSMSILRVNIMLFRLCMCNHQFFNIIISKIIYLGTTFRKLYNNAYFSMSFYHDVIPHKPLPNT